MEKPVQFFTDEYLEHCRKLSPDQIVEFLEQFRKKIAHAGQKQKSKAISMKVPTELLEAFKMKAQFTGRPYQTIIKDLMRQWLLHDDKRISS